jgi:hypothetical protein
MRIKGWSFKRWGKLLSLEGWRLKGWRTPEPQAHLRLRDLTNRFT